MRIAIVSPGYAPFGGGGVEMVVEHTARALAARGDVVEVWTPLRRLATERTDVLDGVTVRRFPCTRSEGFPFSLPLLAYARRMADRFDVVHVHNYHSFVTLALLAIGGRAPTVFSPHYHGGGHGVAASAAHIPYAALGRRALRRSAVTVAVSAAELAMLQESFPSDLGRTAVVHNGTDVEDIAAAVPWPDTPPTVLVLGRLESHKRVDLAIEAFDAQDRPGQLVIIGDGAQHGRLTEIVGRSRRSDDIRLTGRLERAEVLRWLRTARGLISLSEREAFGLVALEAAAAGGVALLSDLPAHREVAELSPAIEVIGAGRHEATRAIERILTSEVAPVAEVRTWSDVAEQYRALYAVAGRAGGPEPAAV